MLSIISKTLVVIMIANSLVRSHWLQRINPLQLFNRKQGIVNRHVTIGSSQKNASDGDNDLVVHVGLKNLGNTCYMNSVLQGLFYCQNFRKIVLDVDHNSQSFRDDATSVVSIFQTLFQKLSTPHSFPSTVPLVQYLNVNPGVQEDAQEFYLKLLDSIHKEVKQYNNSISQNIYNLFAGATESYISSLDRKVINFYKTKNQKMLDLSLDIATSNNIYDSISEFLTPVILDGENKYNTKEYGKISVEKGLNFLRLPKVLSIQLNRFAFDMHSGDMTKLGKRVEFPLTLDMSMFMNRNSTDESQSKLNNSLSYDLKSVVVHIGTPTFGHYIALVRPFPYTKPDYWLLLDDETVSPISQSRMEEIAFGGNPSMSQFGKVSSTAYMLMYEQKT